MVVELVLNMTLKIILSFLATAQLELCGAFTAPSTTAACRPHKGSAAFTSLAGPKTSWASTYGASSSHWSCGIERELDVDGLLSTPARGQRTSQRLSMTSTGVAPSLTGPKSVNWPLWYVLPIAPYQRRKTIMKEIVPGKVWRVGDATIAL